MHGSTIHVLTTTDPAAGVEIDYTIDAALGPVRLSAVNFALVASAGAANREVNLLVSIPGGAWIALLPSGVNQIASENRQYSFINQLGWRGAGATALNIGVSIGDLILPAGSRIRTATTNIQAGDNFSAAFIVVERVR